MSRLLIHLTAVASFILGCVVTKHLDQIIPNATTTHDAVHAALNASTGDDSIRPTWDKGGIYAPLTLANMVDGHLDIENDSTVYIEAGANSYNTLWDEESKKPGFDANTYILTFEPIMDKYAKLLTRTTGQKDTYFRLGRGSGPAGRNFFFPIAISPGEPGHTTFNLSPVDGCSSILKANTNHTGPLKGWPQWVNTRCANTVDVRRVPTISLETVLREWLPDSVKIGRVKIDAQGFDVKVVESFGTEASRVGGILTIEVIGDNADPLYIGQPKCTEVLYLMQELGWKTTEAYDCKSFTEENLNFVRDPASDGGSD